MLESINKTGAVVAAAVVEGMGMKFRKEVEDWLYPCGP